MKCLSVSIASILLLCGCGGVTQKNAHNTKVDAKGGYKNLRLNAPYSAMKGKVTMELVLDDQCATIKKYGLPEGEYLSIGGIVFQKGEALFVRDSLTSIDLTGQCDAQQLADLRAIYRKEFGEPSSTETEETGGIERISTTWQGNNVDINIQNFGTRLTTISYGSLSGFRRQMDEEEKCKERKLEKGRSDL